MAYGYFQDEHGDKSASRLMSFIALIAVIAMSGYMVYSGKGIPELHWAWVAIPLGFYLIGKVGQPTADVLMSMIVGRIAGPKP